MEAFSKREVVEMTSKLLIRIYDGDMRAVSAIVSAYHAYVEKNDQNAINLFIEALDGASDFMQDMICSLNDINTNCNA